MKQLNHLGLRIQLDFKRVDAALVEQARSIPVAVVGDVANRLQAFTAGFNQYGRLKRFAGPALTVRVRPGDNLLLHQALDKAQPGDVVVVDAG
ncbi:MAG: RraA family protein, partial [Betaproteobacteria bacterium]